MKVNKSPKACSLLQRKSNNRKVDFSKVARQAHGWRQETRPWVPSAGIPFPPLPALDLRTLGSAGISVPTMFFL